MYHLLVFDLDGTLVDSRQDLADATNRLIAARGGRPLDRDAVVQMVGEGAAKLVARAFEAVGLPQSDDALPQFLDLYAERLAAYTRPYPGVPQMLEALAPRIPLAVLTNKPRYHSKALLEQLDLARFFRRIVGGDGPYPRKPDPRSLLALAEEFSVGPRDTLLVGDSKFDLRTGRAAAVGVALVRYGFGFTQIPGEELASADYIADSPQQVVAIATGERDRPGAPLANSLPGVGPHGDQ